MHCFRGGWLLFKIFVVVVTTITFCGDTRFCCCEDSLFLLWLVVVSNFVVVATMHCFMVVGCCLKVTLSRQFLVVAATCKIRPKSISIATKLSLLSLRQYIVVVFVFFRPIMPLSDCGGIIDWSPITTKKLENYRRCYHCRSSGLLLPFDFSSPLILFNFSKSSIISPESTNQPINLLEINLNFYFWLSSSQQYVVVVVVGCCFLATFCFSSFSVHFL